MQPLQENRNIYSILLRNITSENGRSSELVLYSSLSPCLFLLSSHGEVFWSFRHFMPPRPSSRPIHCANLVNRGTGIGLRISWGLEHSEHSNIHRKKERRKERGSEGRKRDWWMKTFPEEGIHNNSCLNSSKRGSEHKALKNKQKTQTRWVKEERQREKGGKSKQTKNSHSQGDRRSWASQAVALATSEPEWP